MVYPFPALPLGTEFVEIGLADLKLEGRPWQIRVCLVTITPALAEIWLGLVDFQEQRVRGRTGVAKFASALRGEKGGAFNITHQGLCFALEPLHLVDGQHRLTAIRDTGISARCLVFWMSDPKFRSIDTGIARKPNAMLHVSGSRASALAMLYRAERNDFASADPKTVFTLEQLEEAREHHPSLSNIAEVRSKQTAIAIGGVQAALAYAWPIDPQRVADFYEQVRTGELLSRGMPAYKLREWCLTARRRHPRDYFFATCSAIVSHLNNERVTSIFPDAASTYRALTTARRQLGIPHTPTREQCETLSLVRAR